MTTKDYKSMNDDDEEGTIFKALVIVIPIGIAMWLGLWYIFKWLFL